MLGDVHRDERRDRIKMDAWESYCVSMGAADVCG